MIREVDLVSYLPPFLAEFVENAATLEAENPEFRLVWEGTDRVLKNEFIATADEYGISRFERLLHIFPSSDDTLESRRARVQTRWFNSIPYTWRVFLERLTVICGENNFKATAHFVDGYLVELELFLELYGQIEEVEHMIETMFPANITFTAKNNIPCNAEGVALFGGGICYTEYFFITNDGKIVQTVNGVALVAGGIADAAILPLVTNDSDESYSSIGDALHGGAAMETVRIFATNDSRENFSADGSAIPSGGVVNTAKVVVTNDFKEKFNINGQGSIGSGVLSTEFLEIKNLEE